MKITIGTAHSKHRLYSIWGNMKQRCNNPNANGYAYYGGKGVKVCSDWAEHFASFYKWSTENGYADNLTIDRIDSDGNYEPNNCRWITKSKNSRRASISAQANGFGKGGKPRDVYEYNNKSKSLTDWSEELGIPYETLRTRIHTYGWSIETAFSTPVGESPTQLEFNGKSMSLKAWAQELSMSYSTLYTRIYTRKWAVERAFTTPPRR